MPPENVKDGRVLRAVDERRQAIAVANGSRPPDLVVRGATLANVYSGEWLPWNVEVAGGRIAYVGPRDPHVGAGTEVVDARGLVVAPAYIEPHAHPWAIYNPASLAAAGLARGTATLVGENLLATATGVEGIAPMLAALDPLPGHLLWTARVDLGAAATAAQLDHRQVVACGELGRWRDIAAGDPEVLAAYEAARVRGRVVDGHAAGASFPRLAALGAAGYSADHEAISAEQALERLRLGLWTILRDSSLRRDLAGLVRGLCASGVDAGRLILTSDGSGPAWYADQGMADGLLATAVDAGLEPMAALRAVTLNPATYLRLDHELGGLAPGRRASFVLLDGPAAFTPRRVYADGRLVAANGELVAEPAPVDWDALGCRARFAPPDAFADPALYDVGTGSAPAMRFENAVVTRPEHLGDGALPDGAVHAALVDRGGRWVVRGVATGLFDALDGLASSYTAPQELLVVGRDPASMAAAAAAAASTGGGIALASGGAVTWSAPLDILGMATSAPFAEAVRIERQLRARFAAAGYRHDDPFYTLLFLAHDNIPDLKLTPDGLLEVKTGRRLSGPQRIGGG